MRDTSRLNIRHSDDNNGIAWVLHRNNGNPNTPDVNFFAGSGTRSPLYEEGTTAQSNDYVITLDVTDADNVLMSLNVAGGALEVDEFNAGDLASLGINGVGFSHDSGGVSGFDNFELTSSSSAPVGINLESITAEAGTNSGKKVTLAFTAPGLVDVYASENLTDWTAVATDLAASPFVEDDAPDARRFYVLVTAGTTFPPPLTE